MNKVNILLTEANGNLSGEKEMIMRAVKAAEGYVFPAFEVDWDIDLVVTNRMPEMVIPEDGVGGHAHAHDFIVFAIDEKKASENLISEMVVHELCHAARWGKNDEWFKSMFDGMISEGLATYLEAEFVKNRKERSYFIKKILERTDEKNEKILNALGGQLDDKEYDYRTIFFAGNDKLPRWSGYSLGYYFVKKYLEKTGKKIEDAFDDKYAEYKKVLLDS